MDLFFYGKCKNCGEECIWMPMVDGILAEYEVCSTDCYDKLVEKGEVKAEKNERV